MPDGGGVFFLEEFGIRGAAAFTDFLSDGSEELLCPLEYGIAAGIFWSGFSQQGVESFGGASKRCARRSSERLPYSNGRRPAIASKKSTPKALQKNVRSSRTTVLRRIPTAKA